MKSKGGSQRGESLGPVTYVNDSFDTTSPPDQEQLLLGAFAQTLSSAFEGPNVIERMGCVNRSKIGGYSNVGFSSYLADCTVGRYCNIGARVSIGGFEHPQDWLGLTSYQWGKSAEELVSSRSKDLLELNPPPIQRATVIGSDVWIGDNAVIKRGVTIGSGAIVGAGSVVTKDVPSYAVVVGVPARLYRYRFDPIVRQRLLSGRWWENELEELADLPFRSVVDCIEILSNRATKDME